MMAWAIQMLLMPIVLSFTTVIAEAGPAAVAEIRGDNLFDQVGRCPAHDSIEPSLRSGSIDRSTASRPTSCASR